MPRDLTYRYATSPYYQDGERCMRVRFEVVCAEGLDENVFAWRLLPLNPRTAEAAGYFSHVCSAADLEEMPAESPREEEEPPWFRLSFVDVVFRTSGLAEQFIEYVRHDLLSLVTALRRLDTLTGAVVESIGTDCQEQIPEPSDSSSSSGDSASYGAEQTATAVATFDQQVGAGAAWIEIGDGAGTGLGDTYPSAGVGISRSKVSLTAGESSRVLLVQGFDLSEIPETAEIVDITATIRLRRLEETSSTSASTDETPQIRLTYLSLYHPQYLYSEDRSDDAIITGDAWTEVGYVFELPEHFTSLTGRDLLRGEFGLAFVVTADFDLVGATDVEIDGVELSVFYREVFRG